VKVLHEAPGGGPAPIDASPPDSPSGASALRGRLERLRNLDGAALREEWRRLCRSEPPRISRDLLLRAIAYCLQEMELGELPRWARRSLAGSAAESDPADAAAKSKTKPAEPSPLKPGARLVREWHGRTHVVAVLDDAFAFEGRRYGSLTQIAREITGAHWSGPRFFGLTKRRAAPRSDATPGFAAGAAETCAPPPFKQSEPSNEARPEVGGAHESDARSVGQRTRESARG
jgi:Protein of unknown function (DUF2924)